MKRARYLELAKIADDICLMLVEKKVNPNEGCIIRRVAETQWDCMRASYDEVAGIAEQPCDPTVPTAMSDSLG